LIRPRSIPITSVVALIDASDDVIEMVQRMVAASGFTKLADAISRL
jgi:hypothetical protein